MGNILPSSSQNDMFDMEQINGHWFQIARTPNAFQDPNAYNSVVDYTVNGNIVELNYFELNPDGSTKTMNSIGAISGNNIVSDGNVVCIEKYMIELGFLVVKDSHCNLWLLSKDKFPLSSDLINALKHLEKMGVCTATLIATEQE